MLACERLLTFDLLAHNVLQIDGRLNVVSKSF